MLIILPFLRIRGNSINQQLISMLYLIAGSVCLLIVLIKNMEKLFKLSIFDLIKGYFLRCPLIKKHYVLTAEPGNMQMTSDNVELMVNMPWKTQKERLAEIERQITQIKQLIFKREKYLQEQLDIHSTQIKQMKSLQKMEIEKVAETISDVIIGDYKLIILSTIFTFLGIIFS